MVFGSGEEIITILAKYNYWGTTNISGIQEKIYDYYDNPYTNSIVDFIPFLCEPYPTDFISDLGGNCIADEDGDGFNAIVDCDDNNASIYPGATEVCNNQVDDNCNNYIDLEDQDCPFSYSFKQGWNLFGYIFPTQSVITALASINGCYQSVLGWLDFWNSYNPLRPLESNTLKNLTFGRGYWIKVNCTEINWTY